MSVGASQASGSMRTAKPSISTSASFNVRWAVRARSGRRPRWERGRGQHRWHLSKQLADDVATPYKPRAVGPSSVLTRLVGALVGEAQPVNACRAPAHTHAGAQMLNRRPTYA